MKLVLALILALLLSSFATIVYAEDVLIIHQGYANSHIKWKNRLEDAGHTVTSVQVGSNGSSFPSNTTSYEQIYDLINLPYHLVQDYSGGQYCHPPRQFLSVRSSAPSTANHCPV